MKVAFSHITGTILRKGQMGFTNLYALKTHMWAEQLPEAKAWSAESVKTGLQNGFIFLFFGFLAVA